MLLFCISVRVNFDVTRVKERNIFNASVNQPQKRRQCHCANKFKLNRSWSPLAGIKTCGIRVKASNSSDDVVLHVLMQAEHAVWSDYYAPAPRRVIMRCLCLTSVCLTSVAYIGSKSRTERCRKTEIGTDVAHVTCDSDATFNVKRPRSPGRFTHRGLNE